MLILAFEPHWCSEVLKSILGEIVEVVPISTREALGGLFGVALDTFTRQVSRVVDGDFKVTRDGGILEEVVLEVAWHLFIEVVDNLGAVLPVPSATSVLHSHESFGVLLVSQDFICA